MERRYRYSARGDLVNVFEMQSFHVLATSLNLSLKATAPNFNCVEQTIELSTSNMLRFQYNMDLKHSASNLTMIYIYGEHTIFMPRSCALCVSLLGGGRFHVERLAG